MNTNTQTPATPTLDLRIEAPIELRSISVAVGTIINDYSGRYLCVACGDQGKADPSALHAMPPCAGCDAPWILCRLMCCSSIDRRDNTDIHLIKLCDHE